MLFENKDCYFFWKPPEIASTRGKQQSFLDILFKEKDIDTLLQLDGSRNSLPEDQKSFFLTQINSLGITGVDQTKTSEILHGLANTFNAEQEFGLLNRLDNVTSGLLYFAKDLEIYSNRKKRQDSKLIYKYYLAKTGGPVEPQVISIPLAHHKNGKKMIIVDEDLLKSKRKQKIKGSILQAQTTIHEFKDGYVIVGLHKGYRHQIRIHLASIGHAINGESLYADFNDTLQLYSIGFHSLTE